MKLDQSKPYATIYGAGPARFLQDDREFTAAGLEIVKRAVPSDRADLIIAHDGVKNAEAFLKVVLRAGPVSKAGVLRACEGNNQDWANITSASETLRLVKFSFKGAEHWKLPSDVEVIG